MSCELIDVSPVSTFLYVPYSWGCEWVLFVCLRMGIVSTYSPVYPTNTIVPLPYPGSLTHDDNSSPWAHLMIQNSLMWPWITYDTTILPTWWDSLAIFYPWAKIGNVVCMHCSILIPQLIFISFIAYPFKVKMFGVSLTEVPLTSVVRKKS